MAKKIKILFDISAPSLSVSEILPFEKVGQGRVVKLSQWRPSMANIKIYKSRMIPYSASSRRFRVLTFQMFNLEKVGQCH